MRAAVLVALALSLTGCPWLDPIGLGPVDSGDGRLVTCEQRWAPYCREQVGDPAPEAEP